MDRNLCFFSSESLEVQMLDTVLHPKHSLRSPPQKESKILFYDHPKLSLKMQFLDNDYID